MLVEKMIMKTGTTEKTPPVSHLQARLNISELNTQNFYLSHSWFENQLTGRY